MLLYKRLNDLKAYIVAQKDKKKSIGFVPTMGALHEGHMSLIKKSVSQNDFTICSIFINPTQFNEKKDLEKYPITITEDVKLLVKNKNNILFLPSVEEIYPDGTDYNLNYDFGPILGLHEGAFRPGHFEGMIQVINRFLEIINPDNIYMGQKDYQQAMIVHKLLVEAKMATKLVVCPIIREKSGLAMSSRNRRLSEEAKKTATIISKTLYWIQKNMHKYTISDLEKMARKKIENKDMVVDYLRIVNANTLEDITEPTEPKVALTAAWIEGIRLIDNLSIEE